MIDGDEESIPHVGIWEDDDDSHSDRINQYWRAVGKPRFSGYDCKQPWSAAFISWIMQAAGVPNDLFPPSRAHRSYLNRFAANADDPYAALVPRTIYQYKPKPGDLICAIRGKIKPPEVLEELQDLLYSWRMHCDIVVETNGQTLQAIGGNVRNSVSKTILTLSPDGYTHSAFAASTILSCQNPKTGGPEESTWGSVSCALGCSSGCTGIFGAELQPTMAKIRAISRGLVVTVEA